MTENFFFAALIAIGVIAFVPMTRGLSYVVLLVGVIAAILGLLSGYGVLPEWQG